jgi:hypothetical protein
MDRRFERRFDGLEAGVNSRFDSLNSRFDSLQADVKAILSRLGPPLSDGDSQKQATSVPDNSAPPYSRWRAAFRRAQLSAGGRSRGARRGVKIATA